MRVCPYNQERVVLCKAKCNHMEYRDDATGNCMKSSPSAKSVQNSPSLAAKMLPSPSAKSVQESQSLKYRMPRPSPSAKSVQESQSLKYRMPRPSPRSRKFHSVPMTMKSRIKKSPSSIKSRKSV